MQDIIVFAEDFGGLPSSTQHLIKRLAQTRKVLWVNSIGLRQPGLNRRDLLRLWYKLQRKITGTNTPAAQVSYNSDAHSNITQVDLVTIPAPSSALARRIARDLMLNQLLPVIKKLQLHQPLLWCSLPTAVDLSDHIAHRGLIYYCGDDFSSLAGVDHQVVARHEAKLVSKADLILVASEKLQAKFPTPKTHLLPHGVDTELFTQPVPRAPDLPAQGSHVAGFYGSLSEWLDFELIDYCAAELSDWQFVFIGPQCVETRLLPQRNNIRYLGPRSHQQLPAYSQHWDVGILPFRNNAQIEACNPLKLMEYMAAGQPVVSVDFPALHAFKQHIHIADNPATFVEALIAAKNSPRISHHAVQGHSWDDRCDVLNLMLETI